MELIEFRVYIWKRTDGNVVFVGVDSKDDFGIENSEDQFKVIKEVLLDQKPYDFANKYLGNNNLLDRLTNNSNFDIYGKLEYKNEVWELKDVGFELTQYGIKP